jgi:hypothetical protein
MDAERQPLLNTDKDEIKRLKKLKISIAVLVVFLFTTLPVLLYQFKNPGTVNAKNKQFKKLTLLR